MRWRGQALDAGLCFAGLAGVKWWHLILQGQAGIMPCLDLQPLLLLLLLQIPSDLNAWLCALPPSHQADESDEDYLEAAAAAAEAEGAGDDSDYDAGRATPPPSLPPHQPHHPASAAAVAAASTPMAAVGGGAASAEAPQPPGPPPQQQGPPPQPAGVPPIFVMAPDASHPSPQVPMHARSPLRPSLSSKQLTATSSGLHLPGSSYGRMASAGSVGVGGLPLSAAAAAGPVVQPPGLPSALPLSMPSPAAPVSLPAMQVLLPPTGAAVGASGTAAGAAEPVAGAATAGTTAAAASPGVNVDDFLAASSPEEEAAARKQQQQGQQQPQGPARGGATAALPTDLSGVLNAAALAEPQLDGLGCALGEAPHPPLFGGPAPPAAAAPPAASQQQQGQQLIHKQEQQQGHDQPDFDPTHFLL